jgi:chromosome segregation ATPase
MTGEISLDMEKEDGGLEREQGPLERLEDKIGNLLLKYEDLKKERDELAAALDREKEKGRRLGKEMESLSQDKDKVRGRIDQLLQRLKGVDI